MIVQADLADGADLGVFQGKAPIDFDAFLVHMVGVVGMAAHGAVDPVVFRGEPDARFGRFQVAGGVHEVADALFGEVGKQLGAVAVEALVVHVGMGIKQVHSVSFRCCR